MQECMHTYSTHTCTWNYYVKRKTALSVVPRGTSSASLRRNIDARWQVQRTAPTRQTYTGGSGDLPGHRQGCTWSCEGRWRPELNCASWWQCFSGCSFTTLSPSSPSPDRNDWSRVKHDIWQRWLMYKIRLLSHRNWESRITTWHCH